MLRIHVTPAHNQALHPTPEASAFFSFAISEQNFAFAKSSLASGAGELHEPHRNRVWIQFTKIF